MVQREEEEGGRKRRSSGALIFPKQTSFKLVITRRCSFSAETPDFMERKHKMLWRRPFEVCNHLLLHLKLKPCFLYSCLFFDSSTSQGLGLSKNPIQVCFWWAAQTAWFQQYWKPETCRIKTVHMSWVWTWVPCLVWYIIEQHTSASSHLLYFFLSSATRKEIHPRLQTKEFTCGDICGKDHLGVPFPPFSMLFFFFFLNNKKKSTAAAAGLFFFFLSTDAFIVSPQHLLPPTGLSAVWCRRHSVLSISKQQNQCRLRRGHVSGVFLWRGRISRLNTPPPSVPPPPPPQQQTLMLLCAYFPHMGGGNQKKQLLVCIAFFFREKGNEQSASEKVTTTQLCCLAFQRNEWVFFPPFWHVSVTFSLTFNH